MEVAYSGRAMRELLALDARERARAVTLAETLSATKPDIFEVSPNCLPLNDGGDLVLVPFSESGDLVVSVANDRATVIALIDVVGSLEGTVQP